MSGRQAYLYWSNLELFEKCPQRFLWTRGWGTLDVGGGPGRPKPTDVPDDRSHAVMGLVIGKAVELLYNEELWRSPETLPETIEKIVSRELTLELGSNYIDWSRAGSREAMERTCREGALGYLRTMRTNRFLGPYARAEVDLRGWVNKTTPIGGRPDIIIRRDDSGVTILDGKNVKDPVEGVDPDQLRWYALCYYLANGKLPDRLGFVFFRYPEGTPPRKLPDGETAGAWTGVRYVPVTSRDIASLGSRASDAREAMTAERFPAKPSGASCKYCGYEAVCPERQEQLVQIRKNRKPSEVETVADGILDFSFDR